ncbi:MAG: tRNA adenosine(34) deaminase TadA [Thermodesulfobacteriota bacterium]
MDEMWMGLALAQARHSARLGEVPIGAALVAADGTLLSAAGNCPIGCNDPTAHAEIIALRRAAALLGNYRLNGTTLYVTLEPCVMCAGALVLARVARVVYGATDAKGGGMVSHYGVGGDGLLNHTLALEGGVLADECAQLLKDFFRQRRKGGAAGD